MQRFTNPRASALALVALTVLLANRASAQTGPITASRGRLLVLPVGISQHERPGNDLEWADQDARDHAAFWKAQQGRLFGEVHCHGPLLNRQATRANLLRAMAAVADQARTGDTVIAAWSGHGADPRMSGQWLFCTADGFLSANEVRTWVVNLTRKGARVVLILDTCHAAAVNLRVDGAVVLAACGASEGSSDGDPIALRNNGLFTRVLLEALRGQADRNGDGIVTLDEVMDYVTRHLAQLDHRQRPEILRLDSTPITLPLASAGALPVPAPVVARAA